MFLTVAISSHGLFWAMSTIQFFLEQQDDRTTTYSVKVSDFTNDKKALYTSSSSPWKYCGSILSPENDMQIKLHENSLVPVESSDYHLGRQSTISFPFES